MKLTFSFLRFAPGAICVWLGQSLSLAEEISAWSQAKELIVRTARVALADADRMENNRRAFALAAVTHGHSAMADEVLGLGATYASADSYASTALEGWPSSPREVLENFISQGLLKVPLAVGYQPEEAKVALAKLALVGGFSQLLKQAEAIVVPNPSVSLREDLRRFRHRYSGSLWDRLLMTLRREDGWKELQPKATEEETRVWKDSRILDSFSSQLLLSEALRRAIRKEPYPGRWVAYAILGLKANFYNSAPLQNGVLAYRLALVEGRAEEATAVLELVEDFVAKTPAVSFSSYYALLDLAEASGSAGQDHAAVLTLLEKKSEQAAAGLNPYEKMLVYPQLAAAFLALGQTDRAAALREEALAILEKDVDPESKGVGLTRLWLSFAVAGDAPGKKFAERMERQSSLVVGDA